MVSDGDFNYMEMQVGPDIYVPPVVADYLFSRMGWIREGEQGNFQVEVPRGYDFADLATLAHLIVTDDLGPAKVLADNLPRSQMWMEPSSTSLLEGNANYTLKNPFKRRRGKKGRRNRKEAAENSVQVKNCIIFPLLYDLLVVLLLHDVYIIIKITIKFSGGVEAERWWP